MTHPESIPPTLPNGMSPQMAMDLGLWCSGHLKETGLARYLALAFLYLSWHFDDPAPLDEFHRGLQTLTDDDGPALLEDLAHPPAYSRRGASLGRTPALVKEAQRAALSWKAQLTRPGLNPLRLHARALELLAMVAGPAGSGSIEGGLHHLAFLRILDSHSLPHAEADLPVDKFRSAVDALQFFVSRSSGVAQITEDFAAIQASAAVGVPVFEPMAAKKALLGLSQDSVSGETNALQRKILAAMSAGTGLKGLSEVPSDCPLDSLYERFPNFHAPLEFIADSLALSACGSDGAAVRIPPILLKGPPGTGKTFFAQELSRVLGTHYVERDLSVTSHAFVLTGLDPSWKNSKPGLVHESLVNGPTANPLIALNEVDKCESLNSRNSPLASLYSLLEPASSRNFKDEFVGIPLDASKIVWVLTANDGFIPEPILTRLEVFNIELPSPAQCRAIAASVWKEVLEVHMPKGSGFSLELPEEILTLLSKLSPRFMRKALTRAAGAAARKHNKTLQRTDLESSLKNCNQESTRTIGFLA